jgi:hypothetical protein
MHPNRQCTGGNCKNKATMRCSTCKSRYYCSTECQKKEWNVHKDLCKLLERVHDDDTVSGIKIMTKELPTRDETDPMVFVNYATNKVKIEDIDTHCSVMFKDIDTNGSGEMIIREQLSLPTLTHLMTNSNYNTTLKHWKKHIDLHYEKGDLITILIYDWLTTYHFVKTICFIRVKSNNTLIVL